MNDVSFSVDEGSLFAILGSSGCGKTTILRLLAGLDKPDRGSISIAGQTVTDDGTFIKPEQRSIGYIFQEFALFPHLTVEDNIRFGLRSLNRSQQEARVAEVVTLLDLQGYEQRMPYSLSGGEQQRVAVARSVAPSPRLLLMDEPFSSLDASLRQETRSQIREVLKAEGITTVLVTHDQEEALSIADVVAVLSRRGIEQVGSPEDVYYNPHNVFVAEFLGRTNLLESVVDGTRADTRIGILDVSNPTSGKALLSIRPEHLGLREPGENSSEAIGTVMTREFKGHDITFQVDIHGATYLVHTDNQVRFEPGDRVVVYALQPAVVLHTG